MELRDYLRIGRAHWLGIVAIVALSVGVALAWALVQPRVYTADANGIVVAATDSQDRTSGMVGNSFALSRVKSYVELGSWRSVAEHAIAELELKDSPEALVRRVTVTNPVDTVVIQVKATGPTPESARDLAAAWVRGMQVEIKRIETPADGGDPQMRLDAADSARLPLSPTSPNTRLALAIGAIIGLALGAAYAFLRYTLDRRVRSPEAVESETGLTVIGTIPDEKSFSPEQRLIPFSGTGRSSGKKGADLHVVSEAMRELRTNIQYLDVDNPPRAFVVTSALPGEGKSTTAANLAITLSASGQRVVLIDGDLRRPMVAKVFGLPGEVGLTDVLAGRAAIKDVTQLVGPHRNLVVVAAGKLPPNPSELLGSKRMHDLVEDLARLAYVIIDAPPLIPVTDAAVLSHNTDGAILVTTVGKTTIDALQKAQSNLDRAGGRALGVVLNRVPRKGAGSAYYGYQYTGDYYRSSGEEPVLPDEQPLPTPAASTPAASTQAQRAHTPDVS
ncbi:MAG: polysaccharide biosynthesis tyrosine autokinase [Tessaracoccus sp.]|uniref:polysaccharide biosynthesis tyrosine autokinase n=1 Tax=Tessaracoccus sp. TaxID=1971211 RepID=UPI001ED37922|nr:polysaccharide biosynthesis tyrosine autokinase [Tessaracoccus sp.]MBK7822453.1 polysaccharide biosynthesis tyrosine autokinase [Tessaracoccus sp.]